MIHSPRPMFIPVAITILELCFVLRDFEKWGRTYVRTTRAKIMITLLAVTVDKKIHL